MKTVFCGDARSMMESWCTDTKGDSQWREASTNMPVKTS